MTITMNRPNIKTGAINNASAIRFQTQNSVYLFTWIQRQDIGTLVCLSGTFEGAVVALCVEDFRDLAWPDQIVRARDRLGNEVFCSTRIVSVDRGAAS